MPGIVRKIDNCSGHSCFPPRLPTSWATNFFVYGEPVVCNGDTLAIHTCSTVSHGGTFVGTRNFYVNGKSAQFQGDPIDCGSTCVSSLDNFNYS